VNGDFSSPPQQLGYAAGMRALGALLLVACAKQSGHPAVDASGDADQLLCTSAVGTANVVVRMVGPAKVYDRVYAGGIEGGLVNGFADAPLFLKLVFANQSPISAETGSCCATPGSSCCGIDTVSLQVQSIGGGNELGSHSADVSGTDFTVTGTLTITDWIHPLDMPPGHIAGSLSVTANSVTIDGTFDNTFCAGMVGVTI
jgi:hypothetical protein